MLDMGARTKLLNTIEVPNSTNLTTIVEGQAIVSDSTLGTTESAALSAGTGGELFLGVSLINSVSTQNIPNVEEQTAPTYVTPATVSVTLQFAPLDHADLQVYNASTSTQYSYNASPTSSSTTWSLSGSTVTLGGGLAGFTLYFYYTYSPTVIQLQSYTHGLASINFDNQALTIGSIGVGGGLGSYIFTDQYLITQGRFNLGSQVYLGANGMFLAGTSTSGDVVGVVTKVPLVDDSFLGFRLTAANNGFSGSATPTTTVG
jgi:hypothetical protein